MRARVLGVAAVVGLVLAPSAGAWAWPVDGPVLRPFVFGGNPYGAGQHRGIDIGAAAGSSVGAPATGVVSFVGTVPGGGAAVTIRTPDGYSATLVHLGSITAIRGTLVDEGAAVGTIGPSGDAEWAQPYVHLGVRVTAEPEGYVDPLSLLPRKQPPAPPQPEQGEPAAEQAGAGEAEPSDGTGTEAAGAQEPSPAAEAGADTEGNASETADAVDQDADGVEEAAAEDAGAESGAESGASAEEAMSVEPAPTAEETAPAADEGRDAGLGSGAAADQGSESAREAPSGEGTVAASGTASEEADASEPVTTPGQADSGTSEAPAGVEEPLAPSDDPPVVDEGVPPASTGEAKPEAPAVPAATPATAAEAPASPAELGAAAAGRVDEPESAPSAPAPEAEPAASAASEPPAPEPLAAPVAGEAPPRPFDAEDAPVRRFGSVGALVARAVIHAGLSATEVRTSSPLPVDRDARVVSQQRSDASASRQGASDMSVGATELAARAAESGQAATRGVRDVPEARSMRRPSGQGSRALEWLLVAASVLAAAVALAVRGRRRVGRPPAQEADADARIISVVGSREPAEDPGRRGVAVCERPEASRTCRRVRGPVRHLRSLPPPEGERRLDGERDGRARDAGDGRGGQRGRLAA
jgi:Peptidase family M23